MVEIGHHTQRLRDLFPWGRFSGKDRDKRVTSAKITKIKVHRLRDVKLHAPGHRARKGRNWYSNQGCSRVVPSGLAVTVDTDILDTEVSLWLLITSGSTRRETKKLSWTCSTRAWWSTSPPPSAIH
ncbi:PREDICTED: uncharacterized protein LOC102012002 isoform X2 [Chinchilla lanigera]|uniref:uncharacterized protein LOC102012002 isoform X2 n=1 Tax=Chinchilla lanigera TaxID=34839 RepID=UPI000695E72D|nr:PREDICTED: uncharacterized protein LOC102012002 isoform X2 [Chinchilla lanigera]